MLHRLQDIRLHYSYAPCLCKLDTVGTERSDQMSIVKQLRDAEKAATPGEWIPGDESPATFYEGGTCAYAPCERATHGYRNILSANHNYPEQAKADIALACLLHNHAPAIIDVLEAAEREIRLEAEYKLRIDTENPFLTQIAYDLGQAKIRRQEAVDALAALEGEGGAK